MIGSTHVGGSGQVYYLGEGTSFDVSAISGYEKLTVDNFAIELAESGSTSYSENVAARGASAGVTKYKSYDATTGKLTAYLNLSCGYHWQNGGNVGSDVNCKVKAYLIKGKIK